MAKTQVISVDRAMEFIKDGARIMVGGFLGCGSPTLLTDAILARGTKDLTIIANDSTTPGFGVGKLIAYKRVSRLIATHVGTNPETGRQMNAGEMDVELVPQGTFVERIRSAGAGLGGVLTPTGVGTLVEQGKQKLNIDGKDYLVELPLRAEIALITADIADESGNLVLTGSTRNSNTVMATAADIVIAEVKRIVKVGEIDPNLVTIPGVYVDYLVLCHT